MAWHSDMGVLYLLLVLEYKLSISTLALSQSLTMNQFSQMVALCMSTTLSSPLTQTDATLITFGPTRMVDSSMAVT